jgi:phosphatidylinositol glycan class S
MLMVSHLRILPFSLTRQSGPYVVIIFKIHLAAADPHFLASGISNDLVLHFVLFVPSASRRPLYILDANSKVSRPRLSPFNSSVQPDVPSHSNAFILPQWGGIVIYNPPLEASSEEFLSLRHLDPIFSSFSEQLLALLGVPKLPDGVRSAETSTSTPVLTDWQLDALLRWRTLKNVKGSQDTLLSIVKLVEQIGNMPVGKFVKDDVQEALAALDKVLYFFGRIHTFLIVPIGQVYILSSTSLNQALHYSSRAITLASRAFFNPGMLALLYFPAEHKYAVYTPLFASAIIPLVGAALRELVAWRRTWREQRDRARRGTANR